MNANRPTASVRADRVVIIILLAALLALLWNFLFRGALNADEGFYLAASQRIASGDRPYRDFGFTQGPILPWVNLAWLGLSGFTVDGQRLASLAWAIATLSVGVGWLIHRRSAWGVIFFLGLMIGTPAWAEYVVKGKTYAFGSLCVIVATCVLLSNVGIRTKWSVFIVAGALGVGARFPLAAFFVPAGIYLLVHAPTWRVRFGIVFVTIGAAAVELAWAAGGNWSAFVFWTAGFHQETLFRFSAAERAVECLRFGAGIWVGAAIVIFRRSITQPEHAALALLGLAVLINVGFPSTFTEYIIPFLPALSLMLAPALAAIGSRMTRGKRYAFLAALMVLGWSHVPSLNPGLLQNAAKAEEFLRSRVPAGSTVVGSMPEIAVAAGMRVPGSMVMGKFGITEDFGIEIACQRSMLTPAMLCELLKDPTTQAVVQSMYSSWNFVWSNPSYRALSAEGQASIRQAINDGFSLAYWNDDYVIFVRRRSPDLR